MAAPFGEAATSDPHFNDGYYFSAYSAERRAYVFCGLRVHANNNVMDGYAGAVHGTRQTGIRFTRELRGSHELRVGPLRIVHLEPMRRLRLVLEPNASGVAWDLEWSATAPAFLEARHLTRKYGRVTNDLLRYSQTGRATGSLTLPGREPEAADRWYGARDHSWGLRQMMGPHDRPRGTVPDPGDPRTLRLWVPFEVGDHAGFFHLHEGPDGERLDMEGRLWALDSSWEAAVTEVEHEIEYGPGRRLTGARFRVVDATGTERTYRARLALPASRPMGFGYSRGWSDGGNPGVWRGAYLEETYDWEVADPEAPVGMPLGGTEYMCAIEQGTSTGMAHVEHMRYDAP